MLRCAGLGTRRMKARQLIRSVTFGPDALKAIGQAFDDAWMEIAPNVSARAKAVDAARLTLANIVLSLATEDTRDHELLQREAVRMFKLQHRIAN